MKKRIVALLLAMTLVVTCVGTSHAFGILKVIFDGIANQLGLDRGSIPKAPPKAQLPNQALPGIPTPRNPESHGTYIQAEGF